MSLFIASLNSGSNGNCYYIGNEREAVLIDAGISCRETEKRLSRLGLPIGNIKAVFISHEHSDHINGIAVLSGKYNLPVFITPSTLRRSGMIIDKNLQNSFTSDQTVGIGELNITPFKKLHDATDPFSFMIEHKQVKVSVITDVGKACERVIYYFKQSHACFLEANYDEQMLEEGRYPGHLKKRIRGNYGHLSNTQALELFRKHRPPFMSHLLLSHLSENNNHPEIVSNMFKPYAGNVNIVVASRDKETALYSITKSTDEPDEMIPPVFNQQVVQLNLF